MTLDTVIKMLESKLDDLEALYGDTKDSDILRSYYTRVEDIEWIISLLEKVEMPEDEKPKSRFPLPWDKSYSGRRVLKLKAYSRSEALAALDMARTQVLKASTDERINEAVFVTREGCAWMRDPNWMELQ